MRAPSRCEAARERFLPGLFAGEADSSTIVHGHPPCWVQVGSKRKPLQIPSRSGRLFHVHSVGQPRRTGRGFVLLTVHACLGVATFPLARPIRIGSRPLAALTQERSSAHCNNCQIRLFVRRVQAIVSTTSSNHSQSQPPQHDPLARLLFERWSLSAFRVAAAAVVAEVVAKGLQLGWGWRAGDIRFGPFVGWGDWKAGVANLLFSFLITPSIWGAYAWIHRAPAKLFLDLDGRNLFGTSAGATQGDGIQSGRLLSTRWVIAAGVVTAGTAIATWFAADRSWHPYLLIQFPTWMIGWYMLCVAVALQINVIRALRRYFSIRHLQIRPLHPDGCGGLGPLNDYAQRFALLAAVCALGLTLFAVVLARFGRLPDYLPLHIAIAVYLVMSPFCFFATLGTAHRAMQLAKEQLLQEISDAFQQVYRKTQEALRRIEDADLVEIERIDKLRALHDTTQEFPVWPFNWGSIRRFAVVVLSPIVPFIVERVLPVIFGRLF